MSRAAFSVLSVLALVACGATDAPPADGATDGSVDAPASDTAPDAPALDGAVDGSPDAAPDATSDGAPPDAIDAGGADVGPPGTVTLASEAGCFFTPTADDRVRRFRMGEGATYDHLEILFSVIAGPWQPHIPDPTNRTEHILFGLSRANQPMSWQRYLMGAAAVDFLSRPSHFRMFGREEIAMGYTSYTQVSGVYDDWTEGTRYEVFCTVDTTSHFQRCFLGTGGAVVAARELVVDYLDAETHMSTGFDLEIGTDSPVDHDHLQTPQGWQFCDLTVLGHPL